MILSTEDIATRPRNLGAQRCECFNEYSCLNGCKDMSDLETQAVVRDLTHVQTTCDTGTLQWLILSVLCSRCHQTRHLILGEFDFTAPESSQRLRGENN